jgi:H+-transporting ATPase
VGGLGILLLSRGYEWHWFLELFI